MRPATRVLPDPPDSQGTLDKREQRVTLVLQARPDTLGKPVRQVILARLAPLDIQVLLGQLVTLEELDQLVTLAQGVFLAQHL